MDEERVLTSRMAEIERAYRKQHLFQNAKSKGASRFLEMCCGR